MEEGRFDLILLDIMMKGLSGLEVCRQIRGRVDCPILFLSAKDSVKDNEMCIRDRRRAFWLVCPKNWHRNKANWR